MRFYLGKEAVTVHVNTGVYYLPDTLVFTPADSGTESHPVVDRSIQEGGAALRGGTRLRLKWEPFRDGIVVANVASGLAIDQLFVNGKRQHMAHYPNILRSERIYGGLLKVTQRMLAQKSRSH